ncbi:hypothetical protein RSOLAG22IIIB_04235 [Rhizoctonia solani]|uniref:Barwin domain-containing protein n=1 Tax=Rhizoctonia solani TaxID=456999 RepID=A0A0K6FWM6_9AGAM|nr:hypothetical protein RSOLAG22IIIB_04235 [Rhizoctonia solani]
MFSRLLFLVCALTASVLVIAQSDLPAAVDSVDAGSHRAVGVRAAHKRGNPKGRGGRATWYQPGQGNCGGYNKASDMIVALPMSVYSGGKYCGKTVKITNTSNGKTCTAKIVDSCPGCGPGDLDVSPSVFKKISKSLDDGVATINWDIA